MTCFRRAGVRAGGLAAVASLLVSLSACGNPFKPSQNANVPFTVTDLVVGDGPQAQPGDLVVVDYKGFLYDGSKPNNQGLLVDTSLNGQPFPFVLGLGQVIQGWDQGIVGMKTGGIRRLIIPPELAYGPYEQYPIPANATLVFDIQLLQVTSASDSSTASN